MDLLDDVDSLHVKINRLVGMHYLGIVDFCLFHAYMDDFAICFAIFSYLFTHIWTNLLTQCTPCQFLSANVCELQVFTHIYSAQKFPRKIYKKSA